MAKTNTCTCLVRLVISFFSSVLHLHFKTPRYLHRKVSNVFNSSQLKLQKYPSFSHDIFSSDYIDIDYHTLIFNMEETLLKSSSLFPYFMLVAFEGGSLFRAFLLLMLYPFTCLFSKEIKLKIMVMVCFFGIKKDGFMVGRAVLPKFFLEDVGLEGLDVVKKYRTKVGVSDLPNVMIESFLKENLEVDYVVGKELKAFGGYFMGLMEDNNNNYMKVDDLKSILGKGEIMGSNVYGISGSKASLDHPLFSFCKETYLTSEEIKSKWENISRENYRKPLIFHDGRLALRPTPISSLALFLWLPFGISFAILRVLIALCLPYKIGIPILAFTGMRLLSSPTQPTFSKSNKGQLYACNHRTLLDPLYLSFALNNPLIAVTYSLSRLSEILAPIKTVRLTRDRDQDAYMMDKLLNEGDLVICPEGTTCREPFLLRFSPLFTQLNDQIVPVAMNCHVTMFYGTTASGLKCLDPFYFLMNPTPSYTVQLLRPVNGLSSTCHDSSHLRFDVANNVQRQIGEALSFECTQLTRKDKYLTLARNHGIV